MYNKWSNPILSDVVQLRKSLTLWNKQELRQSKAVYELSFRHCPFGGEFAVFAGLQDIIEFFHDEFRFSDEDVSLIQSVLVNNGANSMEGFGEFLQNVSANQVELYSVCDGTVVFPRTPVVRIVGPAPVVCLLESVVVNLVGFATTVATHASRLRLACPTSKQLLELDAYRTQTRHQSVAASAYAFMGGCDATSNVTASKQLNIPLIETTISQDLIASLSQSLPQPLTSADGRLSINLQCRIDHYLPTICRWLGIDRDQVRADDVAAISWFVHSCPDRWLAAVDCFDVFRSGLAAFCAVALAADEVGHRPAGVVIGRNNVCASCTFCSNDCPASSGRPTGSLDLVYLGREIRRIFRLVDEQMGFDWLSKLKIVSLSPVDERTLLTMFRGRSTSGVGSDDVGSAVEVDAFAVGGTVVGCQPVDCAFQLVELDGTRRMQASSDVNGMVVPGCKEVYRLFGAEGHALVDLLTDWDEPAPQSGQRIMIRHPFLSNKRANVQPTEVRRLLRCVWPERPANNEDAKETPASRLERARRRVSDELAGTRDDHLRALNPTPYKVAVSERLYGVTHELIDQLVPVGQLH